MRKTGPFLGLAIFEIGPNHRYALYGEENPAFGRGKALIHRPQCPGGMLRNAQVRLRLTTGPSGLPLMPDTLELQTVYRVNTPTNPFHFAFQAGPMNDIADLLFSKAGFSS